MTDMPNRLVECLFGRDVVVVSRFFFVFFFLLALALLAVVETLVKKTFNFEIGLKCLAVNSSRSL